MFITYLCVLDDKGVIFMPHCGRRTNSIFIGQVCRCNRPDPIIGFHVLCGHDEDHMQILREELRCNMMGKEGNSESWLFWTFVFL